MRRGIYTAIALAACSCFTAYGGSVNVQAEIARLHKQQVQAHEVAQAARGVIEEAKSTWRAAQIQIDALEQYMELLHMPLSARDVAFEEAFLAPVAVGQYGNCQGVMRISFYCPCDVCNGRSDALTASGTSITPGRTIAVDDTSIPLGSRVYIDGYGVFIAEDTGGAIKGGQIDVAVQSHARAYELGIANAKVWVLE